ncbi:MAG: type I restriction-modification system endonuclease [Myxococcota bacterium]
MLETTSNFAFLKAHDDVFLRLAQAAERAFVPDPATTVIKLRQLGEAFAKHAASAAGVYAGTGTNQLDILKGLERNLIIEGRIKDLFHILRREGNRATHEFSADHKVALDQLKVAYQLSIWFHRAFGSAKGFKPGPFVKPEDPEAARLRAEQEVARLRAELAERDEKLKLKGELAQAEAAQREAAEAAAKKAETERAAWEDLAASFEKDLNEAQARFEQTVADRQQAVESQPDRPAVQQEMQKAAVAASNALDLSEDETRLIIDEQLRQAGWEADSELLRHSAGARPQKGKNRAIAEWPTAAGPADYVLFIGLTPVGVVEAKRKHKNVAGVLTQSKRYSIAYRFEAGQQLAPGAQGYTTRQETHSIAADRDPTTLSGAYGWYARDENDTPQAYRVPFLYATNGREYHRQVETKSGIWFLDARQPANHPRALMGWHSPEGLLDMLEHSVAEAEAKLNDEPFDYTGLRDYQRDAVRAVEEAIQKGQRNHLVAMATGTGKTRTVIGLIYRLLKSGRVRRVLFLVDRTALGEQAQNAFKDMRLDQNMTFTEIFEVKELGDMKPDPSTKVHVATVQAMVRRVLETKEDGQQLGIDAYDLIVVDESHRGYNLDREMTEGEMELRGFNEYVSMYRRVLDYFDAIKVGLTATPALHTKEIFGAPVYSYSYRRAVVDGWLIDHEPPTRIVTRLAEAGIHFDKGEQVPVLRPGGVTDLSELEDELDFEVSAFNKRVLTKEFTRVVAEALAEHIDPEKPGKTLVFCVTDQHADDMVAALKAAFEAQWGEIEDNAVQKITGATDKYMAQIRRYKNEKLPSIAVTVDLLTTGIDVPEIVNLVFVRRVRSRILYEQMLGRATRRCDHIGKEVFHIFDAVDLYQALEDVTDMKPVVTQVNIGLDQLLDELDGEQAHAIPGTEDDRTHAHDVLDQIVTRLRRAVRRQEDLQNSPPEVEMARQSIEDVFGAELAELPNALRNMAPSEARDLFRTKPRLRKLIIDLFSALRGTGDGLLISEHSDDLQAVEQGFGQGQKPEDYLESFGAFIEQNKNELAALQVVLQRPRDLTREQLRTLKMELANAGFPEAHIKAAWSKMTNQDIAASIIGFIRQKALGSPLVPYADRVAQAKAKVLGMASWKPGQRKWIERIAAQLEQEVVVDEQAFSSGAFKAKGGYKAIDKQLDGKLDQILDAFGDAVWDDGEAA